MNCANIFIYFLALLPLLIISKGSESTNTGTASTSNEQHINYSDEQKQKILAGCLEFLDSTEVIALRKAFDEKKHYPDIRKFLMKEDLRADPRVYLAIVNDIWTTQNELDKLQMDTEEYKQIVYMLDRKYLALHHFLRTRMIRHPETALTVLKRVLEQMVAAQKVCADNLGKSNKKNNEQVENVTEKEHEQQKKCRELKKNVESFLKAISLKDKRVHHHSADGGALVLDK